MKHVIAIAALAGLGVGVYGASLAWGTEVETFDSPNGLQAAGGNYTLIRDGG